jgi:hypothetical protein
VALQSSPTQLSLKEMNPSKYLSKLKNKSFKQCFHLRTLSQKALTSKQDDADILLSYVTIQALNIWTEFSRAYILSLILSPVDCNGNVIISSNSSIRNFDDVLSTSIKVATRTRLKPGKTIRRRMEPKWFVTNTLLKTCKELDCSNYESIQIALSVGPEAFRYLPTFRNFYAHRNDDTAKKALKIASRYSIPRKNHPNEILLSIGYSRHQPIIFDWLDDITNTINLLC